MSSEQINQTLENLIAENPVLLFMKGNKEAPQCGFSAQVVHILNQYNVEYNTVNVLDDWDIREGIKSYSEWPTIPQLYIRGEFIGGCDIVMELHRKDNLKAYFES